MRISDWSSDVCSSDRLLARGQGRSIARVVIAIAISFIHLADLAIADIARALLGGVQIGCRKDELRAGKRGEIAGALLAIDLDKFLEAVDTVDHRPAEGTRGLRTILDPRPFVEGADPLEHENRSQGEGKGEQ